MAVQQALQIEKRDYQTQAPFIIVKALKETLRALIVMATGLGKTITCGLFLKEYFKGKNSFRVLYICDRNLGLDQAEEEFFEKLNIKAKPSRFYGDSEARGIKGGKQIVFASFQKLASAKEWYKQFPQNHFDMIIVDEAHHAFAPTYYSVIKYFNHDKCPIVGMTATPYRADQKDIKNLFGPPVIDISLEEGIVMGWLANLKYLIMSDDLDNEKLQKMIDAELSHKRKKPSIHSLNQTLFIRKRDSEIVKQIKLHTQGGKKTLIFCQSIAQAEWFTELLGVSSREYHSGKNSKLNAKVLAEFKDGGVKYLLTVDKLNEAFDMPEVEVVVFLRATDSKRIFFQQLGRGLRKTQTKREVLVLDFVANIERLMYLATFAEEVKVISDKVVAGNYLEGKMKNFESDTSLKGGLDRIISSEQGVPISMAPNQLKVVEQPSQRSDTNLTLPPHFSMPEKLFYTIEGLGFSFNFNHRIIEAMKLLKVIHEGFYPTWQEASNAAIKLGIKTFANYWHRKFYRNDLRLPSDPKSTYKNFPGWDIFLTGQNYVEFYSTWQEASTTAKKLGARNSTDYLKEIYKKDPRLPSDPTTTYKNFPGWKKFFGKREKVFYSTWQEASRVVRNLGFKTSKEYRKKYKIDTSLPAMPNDFYKDFPGWSVFLKSKKRSLYKTWQEASISAKKLGIKSVSQYKNKYKKDLKLRANPNAIYSNWPGWPIFLNKEYGANKRIDN